MTRKEARHVRRDIYQSKRFAYQKGLAEGALFGMVCTFIALALANMLLGYY